MIPKWDEFQHRDMARSSVPPWIKNLTRLLNDDDYLDLTAAQRGILHGIWLLYASHRRVLSESAARRKLVGSGSDSKYWRVNLESLNHAGYVDLSASRPARYLASLDLEVEVERERLKPLTLTRSKSDASAFAIRSAMASGNLPDLAALDRRLALHPELSEAQVAELRSLREVA